ncbi:MAG: site-2 protease family protein [Bryobacteraceae bacterium]|nr:site-2 protease family protein [Bryobacteraceae bacterium]
MFTRGFKLFTIFGFEIRLHPSWLLLAFLVTWTLALGFFPFQNPGLPRATYWAMGVAGAAGLFVSIVWHELAHSLVARRYNIPMRGITLFIFGGVAEMEREPDTAKSEFLMAIAGPISSILLGGICYLLYAAGVNTWRESVTGVLAYLAWINVVLALFNMVPAFPLDGGRVLRAALWHYKGSLPKATRIASRIGGAFGILLMILSVFQLFSGNFIGAVWWFLIGMFVRNASEMSYRQVLVRQALEGEPVSRFMQTDVVAVTPDLSVSHLVDNYVYRYHHKVFPVVAAGDSRLLGCISTDEIKTVPREQWDDRRVEDLVRPCSLDNTIPPEADAVKALAKMSKNQQSRLMVVERGKLVAIVALKDLLGFLALKLDLEGEERDLALPAA